MWTGLAPILMVGCFTLDSSTACEYLAAGVKFAPPAGRGANTLGSPQAVQCTVSGFVEEAELSWVAASYYG